MSPTFNADAHSYRHIVSLEPRSCKMTVNVIHPRLRRTLRCLQPSGSSAFYIDVPAPTPRRCKFRGHCARCDFAV